MSAGSMEFISPSKPSISTKAPLLAPNVPMPRIQNSEIFFPGSPLVCMEITPGTFPPSRLATEATGVCRSFTSTEVTAANELIRRWLPMPITTSSSSSSDSVFIRISMSDSFFTTTYSSVSKPTKEMTTTSPIFTLIENFPSTSVMVPIPT